MKRFVTRISLVLLLIIALPVLFVLIKQASTLSENEALVQRVFDEQIETILYSVNQSSENILVSWMNSIDLPLDVDGSIMKTIVEGIFSENEAVVGVAMYDLETQKLGAGFINKNKSIVPFLLPEQNLITKLENFKKNNYQRIESVRDKNETHLYFIISDNERDYLVDLLLDLEQFVNRNMRIVTQQIAPDKFDIAIVDTTLSVGGVDTMRIQSVAMHEQDMWYLPGYKVQIALKSTTINELVTSRNKQESFLLVIMLLVIFSGMVFVLYSVRREIRLAEMKSEFVSNVSHEIRTPLALITMYTETLMLGRVKEKSKADKYLNVIYQETSRLTNMVNRILSFSKMEKNKREYSFEMVDINEIVAGVCNRFSPHFKSNQVDCSIDLQPDVFLVKADSEAVSEMMINLIDNAIKYGAEHDKKIKIQTQVLNNEVRVEVSDNGIGISAKHQKHIFDKFYRVTDGDLAHKAKGSGIGLNIVQQIMNVHNGWVEVKSKPNEGSCFSLIFPKTK